MFRAESAGRDSRVTHLVVAGLAESDGKALHGTARDLHEDPGDRAAVDPAAQERADALDGSVDPKPSGDRLREVRAELGRKLRLAGGARMEKVGLPVGGEGGSSLPVDQQMPRGKLHDLTIDGLGSRNGRASDGVHDGLGPDARRDRNRRLEYGPDSRGEHELLRAVAVEKRVDAEAVRCQAELLGPPVPESEGYLAVEAIDERTTIAEIVSENLLGWIRAPPRRGSAEQSTVADDSDGSAVPRRPRHPPDVPSEDRCAEHDGAQRQRRGLPGRRVARTERQFAAHRVDGRFVEMRIPALRENAADAAHTRTAPFGGCRREVWRGADLRNRIRSRGNGWHGDGADTPCAIDGILPS